MTVISIGNNKYKISLTDSEVIRCFGAYDGLFSMTENVKSSVKALLREVIPQNISIPFSKTIVIIRARVNRGCAITVHFGNFQETEYIFDFENFENLVRAVQVFCRNRTSKTLKSSLYMINDCFRLIIFTNKYIDEFQILNEFCFDKTHGSIALAKSEEYGKLLIKDTALSTIFYIFKEI